VAAKTSGPVTKIGGDGKNGLGAKSQNRTEEFTVRLQGNALVHERVRAGHRIGHRDESQIQSLLKYHATSRTTNDEDGFRGIEGSGSKTGLISQNFSF
jgi:hypothetical protein